MNNFRTIDRQTGFLLPPSVDEWLPEKHLARFVVEVIDGRRSRCKRQSDGLLARIMQRFDGYDEADSGIA
jgi:hypothetical protein